MTRVRALVGTAKGAFVITSDGTRREWRVEGPHFGGWRVMHVTGSARGAGPALRVPVDRLARAGHPALRRRRAQLGAGGERVRVRGRHRHPSVVRRHAAPLGVQPRVAPGARPGRPRHGLRGHRGRRHLPLHRRRRHLGGALGAAHPLHGLRLAAGGRGPLSAHHHHRPGRPAADVRRDLGRGRLPHPGRRRDLGARHRWAALRVPPRPRGPGGPLRPQPGDAPLPARDAVHAEALGRLPHATTPGRTGPR